jgi:hypothetical protein
MTKRNLTKDISAVTGLTVTSLNEVMGKAALCVAHSIYEGVVAEENEVEIDIGIGTLVVKICEDAIKYRFEPSKALAQSAMDAVNNKTSPLLERANETLRERIKRTYKEIV